MPALDWLKFIKILFSYSFLLSIIYCIIKMKNIELYRTIEALVEAKKQQYTPNKPSFAHQYCKKEIQKKRLVPYNPKSKMSKIMKNFHQLDTYVNVQQLFQCINQKISEKKKEDKPQTIFKWKSKQQIVFDDEEAIEKVRQKLGPYNQRIYIKENQQMLDIIQKLEEDSNVASHRKQNSPWTDDLNFYKANSNVEEDTSKFSTQKQKWRYYQGNNYVFDEAPEKRTIRSQIFKISLEKPSLKKKQQKMDLIHQVSTYLQIILENHHKKKWGNNKVRMNQNQISKEVSPARQLKSAHKEKPKRVLFEISRRSTRCTDHKSSFQKSTLSTQKNSRENSVLVMKKSSSNISQKPNNNEVGKLRAKKVGVNENFTFRNRNIKQNLMKKINKFLEFVESEQKQFKKQKNYEISQLDSLQNKEKINEHNLCGRNFMVDDLELRAVQDIVHLQK